MTEQNRTAGALLALDTSTDRAGIAVQSGGVIASLVWNAGRNHTVMLLDQVHRTLGLAGIGPADLAGIAVATGPGAFTGLRVGMSVAKGFCLALDLPIVGVPTLAAAAATALCRGTVTIAVVSAGRGRLAWATYARDDHGAPVEHIAPVNGTPAELAAELASLSLPAIVTGEFDDATGDLLAAAGADILPPALRLRRPEALLSLAAERFAAGLTDDPVTLEPVYLSR
ncbi:MAG: tRNA (adenosine(37)-N6)-threonylcarbamoyltransferase complex dimerization subunit type 1 TsaB [Thermomicrobiales bacterium]